MVYKKYILKNGKRLGPYYYRSIRGKDGKVKSIYLGKNLPGKAEKISEKTHKKKSLKQQLYARLEKLERAYKIESDLELLRERLALLSQSERHYPTGKPVVQITPIPPEEKKIEVQQKYLEKLSAEKRDEDETKKIQEKLMHPVLPQQKHDAEPEEELEKEYERFEKVVSSREEQKPLLEFFKKSPLVKQTIHEKHQFQPFHFL